MKPLRVLNVEDSEDDADLLLLHLKRGGYTVEAERVQTRETMLAALRSKEWDIIISDYQMPVFTGLEAFQVLRETKLDIPFIIISGTIGEETAVQAMVAGVSDYLMKNNLARLVPAIERELNEAANRRAKREAEKSLRKSEERYRDLFENANDTIYTIDLNGKYTSVNKKGEELSGYTREEILRMNFDDVLAGNYIGMVREMIAQKLAGEVETTLYALEIETKSGVRKNVEISSRVIYDDAGAPIGIQGIARDITDRVRLEKDLQGSEARFRALAENNVAGVTLCEDKGRLIYANDAYLSIIGYSREDFENGQLNWHHITAPESREADRQAIRQARELGASEPYEKEYLRRDGGRVSVLLAIAVSTIDGDEYFISAILDITERRKAERELRQSEENFRALVEATAQIVWEIDAAGFGPDFFNWWERQTGQTFDEAKGFGWLETVHRDDRETARLSWDIALTQKTVFDAVYRVMVLGAGAGGSDDYRFFAVRGVPLFNDDGSFRQWVGTFTDITSRKKSEQDLRESENRLQLAITAADLGIWEWNISANTLYWSKRVYDIFGQETPIAEIEDFIRTVHPDDLERVREEIQKTLAENKVLEIEMRILRPDGEIRWISSRGIPDYDESTGNPSRLLGVILDLTERIKAQEALTRSEEKLRQAQKLESIGRLAGGIAHDFNNMLTAINGYSDLSLRRIEPGDPIRGYIEEIKKAGERSAELTHQLLAFSRRQILQPKVLNINQVVSDTSVMLRRLIGEDIHLATILNPGIDDIEADPGQITQVILNLVVNARDAIPIDGSTTATGGTITIETENVVLDGDGEEEKQDGATLMNAGSGNDNPTVRPGNYVLLAVSDTGSGIPEEALENIFEPFYTTKEVGKGTGLGLATIYGIIKQSGGHINVRSQLGMGSRFELYLPRLEQPVQTVEISKELPPADLLRGSETVLLAENEQIVRHLTRQVLDSCGYTVLEAENGLEALEIGRSLETKIDLLLTDLVMPKMGGYELAEKLLQIHPDVKILFTSGHTEAAAAGIENPKFEPDKNFIPKPFEPDDLALKVREVLDAE